ncbi:unnamed protein product [Caenorhabditis brenneri]
MNKSLLAVGILMLCAQLCLSELFVKCKLKNETEAETENYQRMRQDYAEEFQIANMHALKYDPSLEDTIRKFTSCDSLQNGVNHRFDYLVNDDDDKTWKSYLKNSGYKGSNQWSYAEHLHPLQTSYITCEFAIECVTPVIINGEKIPIRIDSLEMFGPVATLVESDFKHGKPGSKCPNGVDENMLCKEPKRVVYKMIYQVCLSLTILSSVGSVLQASTTRKPATQELKCGLPPAELKELVKKYNAHRMEVAERDQIANMHEIRYDFELEKEIHKLTACQNGSFPNFRFTPTSKLAMFGNPEEMDHPLQTGFAFCTVEQCPFIEKIDQTEREVDSEEIWINKIYLYGPKNTPANSEIKEGTPGSQCPNGKAASGLCKASWNTESVISNGQSATQSTDGIDNGGSMTYSIYLVFLIVLFI